MKVALYSRVSTLDQDPTMQEKALKHKAELEAWEYDYFEEKETTRKTRPIKRNLYQKLLNKEYDAVCVWKVDRWARSSKEASTEIETLYNKGIPFISLRDNIDLSTASGKLQFNVIVAFAQFERDIISERTKEGLAVRKKQIEEQGYFINKDGKKVTSLGRPKGKKDGEPRRKSGYYQRWSK
jgi:DNA invertase Pin-like site-specific DNA recombinase